MSSYNKFNAFVADLGLKVHNLDTDVLKILLTNTAPVATNAVKADLTEIAAGSGYTAGGTDAQGSYSQTGGVATLTGVSTVFTAAGGTIGPFRYAVLYNSTPGAGPLIGWWDRGNSITLADTEACTVTFGANIFTLT